MQRSNKQSFLWLAILIVLVITSSVAVVWGIKTTNLSFYFNLFAVVGIVGGATLLSLFKRIQDSEYAYPMWCVSIIIIGASLCCQLIFKYQEILIFSLMGKNGYLYFIERPIQIYFTVLWHLISVILILSIIWLLLRTTKRFVVFGFYDLTIFPVAFAFFMLTLGLDTFYSSPILISFGLSSAVLLKLDMFAPWVLSAVLALSILIKLSIAIIYRKHWIGNVKRLTAVAIVIWCILSLSNDFLTILCKHAANYISVIGSVVVYYFITAIVSWLVFKLFFPHKPISDE